MYCNQTYRIGTGAPMLLALALACEPQTTATGGQGGAGLGEHGGEASAGSAGEVSGGGSSAGGNTAAGGSGGSDDTRTCAYAPKFTACWQDLSFEEVLPELRATGLTVVGNAPPDTTCYPGVPLREVYSVETPIVAWELEDSDGNRGLVEFAIAGLSPELLMPGDVVDVRALASFYGDPYWGGYLAIERDSMPVVVLATHQLPEFPGLPDLDVAGGNEVCAGYHCMRPMDMIITVNGASATLALNESAVVGGFVVHNDGYFDNTGPECDGPQTAIHEAFVLAMHRPP